VAPTADVPKALSLSLLACTNHVHCPRVVRSDQMAISYVLHRMGLTRRGANASRAVRLIERKYHYLTKPSLRPLTLVTKVGHRQGSRKIPR
jgi:hypothetical protein